MLRRIITDKTILFFSLIVPMILLLQVTSSIGAGTAQENSNSVSAGEFLIDPPTRIFQGDRLDLVSPNMFAGSILDLEPDTEYEAKFEMSDPMA